MAGCEQQVDCGSAKCIGRCGAVQWVGNKSNCTVLFQYNAPDTTLWITLGQFLPGQYTDFGQGAVWFPSDFQIRAVAIAPESVRGPLAAPLPPVVIRNFGTVGSGQPVLVVTQTDCRDAMDTWTERQPVGSGGNKVKTGISFALATGIATLLLFIICVFCFVHCLFSRFL